MATFEVQMDDGSKYHVEGVDTPEEAYQHVSTALDSGPWKAAGSGLAQGVVGSSVGLPGDAGKAMEQGGLTGPTSAQMIPSVMSKMPGTQDILKAFGADYTPLTEGEKAIKDTTAGIGGMALPVNGMSTLARSILGALSGAGGYVGEKVGGPLGRILGQVLPMAAQGAYQLRTPNAVRSSQDALREAGPELEAGYQRAADASQTLGTQVLPPQGMRTSTAINGLVETLLRAGGGAEGRRVLGTQLDVGQQKIDDLVASLGQRDVGTQGGNVVAAAGDKALTRPEQVRTQITKDSYRGAQNDTIPTTAIDQTTTQTYSQTPAETVQDIAKQVAGTVKDLNMSATVGGRQVGLYAKRIQKLADDANGQPVNVMELDNLQRELAKKADAIESNPMADGAQKAALTLYRRAAATIRDRITATPPDYQPTSMANTPATNRYDGTKQSGSADLAEGKDLHQRATEAIVNPVQDGPVGRLFEKGSTTGDLENYTPILDATKYSANDVRTVAQSLKRADPNAWPTIVKAWLLKTQKESTQSAEGRSSDSILNDFPAKVLGDVNTEAGRLQRNSTLEGLKQAYVSMGQSEGDALAQAHGAVKMLEAVQMTARDRSSLGKPTMAEGPAVAGENLPSAIIRPFRSSSIALERAVQARTYAKLTEALLSPEGLPTLKRIAKWDRSDIATQNVVQDFLALHGERQNQ